MNGVRYSAIALLFFGLHNFAGDGTYPASEGWISAAREWSESDCKPGYTYMMLYQNIEKKGWVYVVNAISSHRGIVNVGSTADVTKLNGCFAALATFIAPGNSIIEGLLAQRRCFIQASSPNKENVEVLIDADKDIQYLKNILEQKKREQHNG